MKLGEHVPPNWRVEAREHVRGVKACMCENDLASSRVLLQPPADIVHLHKLEPIKDVLLNAYRNACRTSLVGC